MDHPNRRQFLTGMAAGTTCLSAATAFPLLRPQEPEFKKALKLYMVGEGNSLLEKFQLVKELGYDGIELDSPNGFKTADVLAARDATGLDIHGVVDSVHWSQPFSHPDKKVRAEGVEAGRTAIRDAKAYGATSVLIVPAVVGKTISYQDAWNRSKEEIAKLVPEAEAAGIQIAFENVWNNFLLSPLEMARYIDSFKSKMVGAYLDVGNLVRYAWPEHWVEVLGSRIFKVDVKEYSRKKQTEEGIWKGFGVDLHKGDCDWPTVVKALRKIGYRGWFTAEMSGGNKEHLAKIASDMDQIFASK